jgi:hypothetical protein
MCCVIASSADLLPARQGLFPQMSWQAYVDDQIIGTGNAVDGALLSKADGSVWATSPGVDVKFVPIGLGRSSFPRSNGTGLLL